jgi:hypothetical protein
MARGRRFIKVGGWRVDTWNQARTADLDKTGSLLVVRGWFDSEGWFRPSGDFGNPPPLWVRRLLFWDQ